MRQITLLIALIFLPFLANAQELFLGFSQNRVAITADFDGSEIHIFGAIKDQKQGRNTQIILTVEGPKQRVRVHKKERKLGIWTNAQAVDIDAAPSFYTVASSAPLEELLTETEDLRYGISIDRSIRLVGGTSQSNTPEDFVHALKRIRLNEGGYLHPTTSVNLAGDTLFDTRIVLPANLVEGDYKVRVFLLEGHKIVQTLTENIPVRKVGLERWLYSLAYEQPFAYGLLALAIALAAGWLASEFFRRFF